MGVVASVLALFGSGLLLGAMLFFSAIVAPLVFVKLEAETAGRFIRQLFPWYYAVVAGLAAVAAVGWIGVDPMRAALMASVALSAVAARQVLMPAINRHRDVMLAGNEAAETTFNRLHRSSVWLNGAQILTVGFVLAGFLGS